jgi:hypothetical protein
MSVYLQICSVTYNESGGALDRWVFKLLFCETGCNMSQAMQRSVFVVLREREGGGERER